MLNPNQLNHSGIKGQRKGVRRYQYANKTYTPEGNKRYRPSKGQNIAVGATVAATGAAWGTAMVKSGAAGSIATALLPSINITNLVALGADIVAGLASVPTGVWAITLPMAILMTPTLIQSGSDYVEKLLNK